MSRRTKILLVILGLLPFIALIVWGYLYPSSFFSSQESIRDYVVNFGIVAPLILIGIQILQVILTPINHYAVGLAGGFIFGPWYGFLYNYIGRIIGHTIAFYISKTIGRRIVMKVVKPETLEKYDHFWNKRGAFILFLIYWLPLFPDDEISYIVGTSKMKPSKFMLANLLGQTGGSLGLAYIGAKGVKLDSFVFLLILAVFILFWVLWMKYKKTRVTET